MERYGFILATTEPFVSEYAYSHQDNNATRGALHHETDYRRLYRTSPALGWR